MISVSSVLDGKSYITPERSFRFGCIYESKKGGNDQESIQVPHLTQDTTWESDKSTIKHHKQEPRGLP